MEDPTIGKMRDKMKKRMSFTALFLIALAVISCAKENKEQNIKKNTVIKTKSFEFEWQKAIAQKEQKTIEDYFLLLPSRFLDCENVEAGLPTQKLRMSIIGIKDLKNGYIQFDRTSEIVLFINRVENINILGVQIGKSGAGNTCGSINSFYQYDSSSNLWLERDDILPEGFTHNALYNKYSAADQYPYFKLPQFGLNLEVRAEDSEKILCILKWDGQKFVKE